MLVKNEKWRAALCSAAFFAFVCAVVAHGDTITCTGQDNNKDFFRYGTYTKSGVTYKIWSNGLPPSPENDYVISGYTPNTPQFSKAADGSYTNFVFVGKSLTLAKGGTIGYWTHVPSSCEFPVSNGGLRWTGGTIRSRATGGETSLMNGLLALSSSDTKSFKATSQKGSDEDPCKYRATMRIAAKVTGDATQKFSLEPYNPPNNPGYFDLVLEGDCSDYCGTIALNAGTNGLVLACAALPATVTLKGPGTFASQYGGTTTVKEISESNTLISDFTIAPTNHLVVTNLTLKGGTLHFPVGTTNATGCISVMESLAVSGSIAIDGLENLKALAVPTGMPVKATVLRIPADKGTIPFDTITCSVPASPTEEGKNGNATLGLLPNWYAATNLVTDADGVAWWELSVTHYPVILRTCGSVTSVVPDDTHYSDGQSPHGGADYLLPYQSSQNIPWGDVIGRGPIQLTFNDAHSNLLGRTTTAQIYMTLACNDMWISNLTLAAGLNYSGAGTIIETGTPTVSGKPQTFHGNTIRLLSDTRKFHEAGIMFRAYNGRVLNIDAELVGSGALTIEHPSQQKPTSGGSVRLLKTNDSYSGRIMVASMLDYKVAYPPSMATNITLLVGDARELGGELSSFVYNALILDRWGAIEPAVENLTLASPTRGLYVLDHGHVRVPSGKTLALNQALTLSGELYKTGDGRLVLGHEEAPRFTSSRVTYTEALEGTNVVRVAAGELAAGQKESLQGLALVFEGTGALSVDCAVTGELKTGGFKFTDAGSSLTGPNGKVPVFFRNVPEEDCQVDVLTSKSNDLQFTTSTSRGGYHATIACAAAADDDGNYVYTATIRKTGAIIFFQ